MASAGQSGLLGLDIGQGVGDWVDHGGSVKPEPVASHGSELGERGHQDSLGGHDAGGHDGGDGGISGREREPANRTPEAVAGLDQCPSSSSRLQDPQRALMLIGSPSFAYPRWLSAVGVDVLG